MPYFEIKSRPSSKWIADIAWPQSALPASMRSRTSWGEFALRSTS